MSLEVLVIAVLAIGAIALLVSRVPLVRHLVTTSLDLVDGSLAIYLLRDLLGLSTTTARDRRIARRQAREQAELERRIGVGAARPSAVPVSTPTRLVVAGEAGRPVGEGSATRSGRAGKRLPPRVRLVRDMIAVLAVVAVAGFAVSTLTARPQGAVLTASGTPASSEGRTVGEAAATADAPSETALAQAMPSARSRSSRPPSASASVAVGDVRRLDQRLVGGTDDGGTIGVTLRWAAPDVSAGLAGYELTIAAEGDRKRIAVDDPGATSVRLDLAPGRRHEIDIVARDGTGTLGTRASWPPLTAARHQETSSLARYAGAWRRAQGPSLSGGGVTFTRASGASVVVRFTGRDIAWVATRTPTSGRAQVLVDGVAIEVVDLRASGVEYRRIVFRHHAAELGSHRLEIRAVGDGRVDVDAFIVLR